MWVTEGEKIKGKLDGATYTVKTAFTGSAVLESEDGCTQEWTNTRALNLFFEKIENQSDSRDFSSLIQIRVGRKE
jgi:hypothetical protein